MKETLTNEELVALIQNGENVSENMGLLYEQNKRWIYKTVKSFATETVDIDDLMQEAYFALDKAARAFDLSVEYKFLTYLTPTVYGHVQRYLMKSNQIGITVRKQEQIRKYFKFVNQYFSEHGIKPSDQEITAALNINQYSLDGLREIMRKSNIDSLDTVIPGDSDNPGTVGDFIPDVDADIEANYIEGEENRERMQAGRDLWQEVESLSGRRPAVIRGRYHDEKTLQEIGDSLGLTRERVRQIEAAAIKELKKSSRIKDIADRYGYYSKGYRGSIRKFKETGTSITEYLALKSVEEKEYLAVNCIDCLPDCIERTVLQMHYLEKKTVNEISAGLGKDRRTVQRIQNRGLAIIQKAING